MNVVRNAELFLWAAAAAGAGGANETGVRTDRPSQESPSTSQISTAWTQTLNLRIAVLAASAYVSLCLGDYIVALEHARTMLNIEKLPGAYKMLANLYAAESLILVDKMNEAIEHLKPQNIEDLNTGIQTISGNDSIDKDKKTDETTPSASNSEFERRLLLHKNQQNPSFYYFSWIFRLLRRLVSIECPNG